jgi:hypothetical protein
MVICQFEHAALTSVSMSPPAPKGCDAQSKLSTEVSIMPANNINPAFATENATTMIARPFFSDSTRSTILMRARHEAEFQVMDLGRRMTANTSSQVQRNMIRCQ